jgi:hypothetical protein
LLSTHFFCAAQQTKNSYPVITLRTNPFSFLEEDAGIMLCAGLQLNSRWAVNIDPMFIFYSPYQVDNSGDVGSATTNKIRGIKVRGEIRYFLSNYIYGKRGWFAAMEFHYKNASTTKWNEFGMNCTNGQCDFYQYGKYNEVKTEAGIAGKMGWLCKLWSPRWSMEFYTGIGLKWKQTTQRNQPTGATFLSTPNDVSVFSFNNDGALPMFPIGIKLVYRVF